MPENRVTQEEIDTLLDSADTEESAFYNKVLVVSYRLKDRGGFVITSSAGVIDPANFDFEIGRSVCRQNASNTLWQLEGYLRQLVTSGVVSFNEPTY